MHKKNQIYLEMVEKALWLSRNRQTRSFLGKAFDKTCIEELELVHGLPVLIMEDKFGEGDVWFLNTQAKNYLNSNNLKSSSNYNFYKDSIAKITNLLPRDLINKIDEELLKMLE